MSTESDLHREFQRFEALVPEWAARLLRFMRKPSQRLVRVPVAILLVLCGFLGFLPVLGFWMVPLGLALLALDIVLLRRPLMRLLRFVNDKLAPQSAPPANPSGPGPN
jgi:hypothetical protein